jgi:HK97 family phage portal protein
LTWGFGEAKLKVYDEDGQELTEHQLQKLLDRPNPDMSGREFRQTMMIYAAISGNAYAWIQRNNMGVPIALWPLSDAQVAVWPGRDSSEGVIRFYTVADGTGSPSEGQEVAKEDMIHFKYLTDGLTPEKGYGGLQAAARDIDTDNEMGSYTFSLLRNNAVPPVVITMAEGEIVDEDVATRLRQSWKDRLGGNNRGLPAFLEAGMEVKTLGSDLNSAAYDSMRSIPESRIAAVLRVPPILAGLKVGLDSGTYSNYAEARAAFTEDTLSPLWQAFAEVFVVKLVRPDSGITIQFDLADIRSLQDDVDAVWKRVMEAFNAGLITRAEAKIEIGYEVMDFDNVYKVSGATYFIEAGTDPLEAEFGGQPVDSTAPPDDDGIADETEDETEDEVEDGTEDGEKLDERAESIKQLIFNRSEMQEKTFLETSRSFARSLQRTRISVSGRYSAALDSYFTGLAERVSARFFREADKTAVDNLELKADSTPPKILITEEDEKILEALTKRYYVEMATATIGTVRAAIDAEIAFDLTNPVVTDVLAEAGERVVGITETTRQAVAKTLMEGFELGLSPEQIVRGTDDFKGLYGTVKETYRNRSKTIARTELGDAQNKVTLGFYEESGLVERVLILDDGFKDSHETCIWLDGQVRSLEWTKGDHREGPSPDGVRNPLQHPNCVRTFAPYFGPKR